MLDLVLPVAEELRQICGDLGAKNVFTLGISYGGYVALLLGSILGARRTFAFGPETAIGLPATRSERLVRGVSINSPYADLASHLRDCPPIDAHIFCGGEDITDLYSGLRVQDLPGVHVHSAPGSSHTAIPYFSERRTLRPMLSELIEDRFDYRAYGEESGLLDDREAILAWYEGYRSLTERRFQAARTSLENFVSRHPHIVTGRQHLGHALLGLRRFDEAVSVLEAVLESKRADPAVYFLLGRSREGQGELSAAMQYYRDGLAYFPNNKRLRAALDVLEDAFRRDRGASRLEGSDPTPTNT
ncbi:MAG TPA: tetratricopeptide repeat protein [Microvirga sp.]|nr:tetratricopeptide repeat protein [Microvirga sp.]